MLDSVSFGSLTLYFALKLLQLLKDQNQMISVPKPVIFFFMPKYNALIYPVGKICPYC